MGEPFVGEIRMFGGNFAPAGWAFCQGQLMPISENEVLFQLIGTTYGGDGQETFALPDLQGRLPLHQGQGSGLTNHTLGEAGGVESVTLTTQQIPAHAHVPIANNGAGDQVTPENNFWSSTSTGDQTFDLATTGGMNPNLIGSTGGSVAHENIGPFLCVSFIISLFGVFPTQ